MYKQKLSQRSVNIINGIAIFLIILGLLLIALGYGLPGPLTAGLFALRIAGFLLLGIGLLLLLWGCLNCCLKRKYAKPERYTPYRTKTDGAWVYVSPNSQKTNSVEVKKDKGTGPSLSDHAVASYNSDNFYTPPFVHEIKTIQDKPISTEPSFPKIHKVHSNEFTWTKNTVVEVDQHNKKQGILHEELIAYPISDSLVISPPPPYEERTVLQKNIDLQQITSQSNLQRSLTQQQREEALLQLNLDLQQKLAQSTSGNISTADRKKTNVKTFHVSPTIHHQVENQSNQNVQQHAEVTLVQKSAPQASYEVYQNVHGKSSLYGTPETQHAISLQSQSSSVISPDNVSSVYLSPTFHQAVSGHESSLSHHQISQYQTDTSSLNIQPNIQQQLKIEKQSVNLSPILQHNEGRYFTQTQLDQIQNQDSFDIPQGIQQLVTVNGKSTTFLHPETYQWVTVENASSSQHNINQGLPNVINTGAQQWINVDHQSMSQSPSGLSYLVNGIDNVGKLQHTEFYNQTKENSPVTVVHSPIYIPPKSPQAVEKISGYITPVMQQMKNVEEKSEYMSSGKQHVMIVKEQMSSPPPQHRIIVSAKPSSPKVPVIHHWTAKKENVSPQKVPVTQQWMKVDKSDGYLSSSNHQWLTRTTPRTQQKISAEERFITLPRSQQWISAEENSLTPMLSTKQEWITVEGKFPVKSSEIHQRTPETSLARSRTEWIYSSHVNNAQ